MPVRKCSDLQRGCFPRLLLFVYVLGGQLAAGLDAHGGRATYLEYVVPGLMLVTVASVVQGTSIMVAMDMTGGVIDRLRTMAIRLAVALGLAADNVESVGNTPMTLFLSVFLSSGFVRTQTMPSGLRQFAEYQLFSSIVDTVRGLLANAVTANDDLACIAWSVGIPAVGCLWALRLYNRRRANEPM